MRIGVNCFALAPDIGGMRQYFFRLFNYLLQHDQDNEYVFFCSAKSLTEFSQLRSDRWRSRVIEIKSQDDIDVRQADIDLYFCPFAILWPRPAPVPSVVTVHDIQEVFFPEFFQPADRYLRAMHYPGSTRSADSVITVSEFTKQTVEEHHGVSRSRIVTARQCVGESFLTALADPVDFEPPFERYLFYPANRWRHKNHEALLQAIVAIREQRNVAVRLVLTGHDYAGGYQLEQRIQELGLETQVRSVGYVTEAEVAALYSRAAGLVFPSLFEGFGLPLLEAMTAGCPAAVSRIPSLVEIGGESGLYFDPDSVESIADTVHRLWTDAELREQLALAGRERAAQFTPERMALAHLEAFELAAKRFSRSRYLLHCYALEKWHAFRVNRSHRDLLDHSAQEDGAEGVRMRFGKGWHGLEGDKENWWRWSSGRSKITLFSESARKLALVGESLSAPKPNEVRLVFRGKPLAQWEIGHAQSGFQPLPPVEIDLPSGSSTLEIYSMKPAVQSGDDPRKLAVALKNLRFRDPDSTTEAASAPSPSNESGL